MNQFKKVLSEGMKWKPSKDVRWMILLVIMTLIISLPINMENLQKQIAISVDGKTKIVKTYKSTVKDALKSSNIKISSKDKVFPQLNFHVNKGMTVNIKRAVPVKLTLGSNTYIVYTAENTVKGMLNAEGIVINKNDRVVPSLKNNIAKGMNINLVRVVKTTITEKQNVAFRTVKKPDKTTPRGAVRLIRNGTDGQKNVNYKVVYENGKLVSRNKISETINYKPIDKVVAVGTVSWFMPSRGTGAVMYTSLLRVKATSYTNCKVCTGKRPGDRGFGITATGTRTRRSQNGYSTIAVDPKMIPLGTRMYIEGYGFAIAEDTGSAVKGGRIDLYFNPGTKEYRDWSTHNVNVYLLR